MKNQKIFKRYELKYILTARQADRLHTLMKGYMTPDAYGRSRCGSIYFDTPDYRLIRRSLERPAYKEKLRIRFYGDKTAAEEMFLELKKKYDHVVYKRRLTVAEYLDPERQTQISKEIRYFSELYPGLGPSAHISCDREAWYGKGDPDLRLTFDRDIRYKEYLRMDGAAAGYYLPQGPGMALLPEGTVLLEVKTAMGLPRWLLDFLNEEKIYKRRFSKYGEGYLRQRQLEKEAGERVTEVFYNASRRVPQYAVRKGA